MKKKIVQRIAASGLAAMMACGMLAGCGSSTSETSVSSGETESNEAVSEETTQISVVIVNGANIDNAVKVEAAANEILKDTINCEINITWLDWGSYYNQLSLLLTGEDDADLLFLAGVNTAALAESGQLAPITEWYEEDPEAFTQYVNEVFIDANRVDGELYTIPCNNNFSSEACVMVNAEMADALGFDLSDDSKIWTLEEIHDMAALAKETYPDIYAVAPQTGSTIISAYTWDTMGDSSSIGVVEDCGTTDQVVSITECEDFINFARTMHEWYSEGLIMQDVVSNTETWSATVPTGKAFCAFNNGGYPNEAYDPSSCGYYVLSLMENVAFSNSRMCYGISGNSKNPEKAFAVLKELYTNSELVNILCWGIEGENYVLNEDGLGTNPEGVTTETNTYSVAHVNPWVLPNMHISYDLEGTCVGFYEKLEAYDQSGAVSDCVGCVFDYTDVSDEYNACANVMSQYYANVMSGAVDIDEVLDDWKADLKTAGEDIVIAEKQRQLDEFLASK